MGPQIAGLPPVDGACVVVVVVVDTTALRGKYCHHGKFGSGWPVMGLDPNVGTLWLTPGTVDGGALLKQQTPYT